MKRASALLQPIANATDNTRITLDAFLKQLGSQSFALSILILSLPHCIPLPDPPGLSAVTGIPILLIAFQLMLGEKTIRLPRWLGKKKFSPKFFRTLLRSILPAIRLLETILRPRKGIFSTHRGEQAIGLLIVLLALVLCLPIPGGNILPGIAIALLALSLLERDSVLAILSILFSLGSSYFMYRVIAAGIEALAEWVSSLA